MKELFTRGRELWTRRQREIVAVFLLVLVGLACFGWGYRAGTSGSKTPIIIEVREKP